MKQKEYYPELRRRYQPTPVKLAIIAESPPANGKYFYDPEGLISEWLFAALMRQLAFSPKTKHEGLEKFRQKGWILVDATYKPVNKNPDTGRDIPISRRNAVIDKD